MATNYTKLWEAFLGGEYGTDVDAITEGQDYTNYRERTRSFYGEVIGPMFFGEEKGAELGSTDLEGYYASFDPQRMEQAERTFRSAIGDPYGPGGPFAWEKVSRYDTAGGDESRIQQLLEDELFAQGKFLGGETGAEYGTSMAKELETYSTGLKGEREALTYGELTAGQGLASGASGTVLRSGEGAAVSEDILIEAYKKAKGLGEDYRAGKAGVQSDLETDLNDALTDYLASVDAEKSRWYDAVMSNVRTFSKLEVVGDYADVESEEFKLMQESRLEESDYPLAQEWSCGYGQYWDVTEEKCLDEDWYKTERYGDEDEPGYTFRDEVYTDNGACGIGMIWKITDSETNEGECVTRADLDLTEDPYGLLCASDNEGLQKCGECNIEMESCWDGTTACPGECPEDTRVEDCAGVLGGDAEIDDCGVCGGDGPSELCWDQTLVCDLSECSTDPATVEDECGVPGGDGKTKECEIPGGTTFVCPDEACPEYEAPEVPVSCPPGTLGPDGTGFTTGAHMYDYTNCIAIEDETEDEIEEWVETGCSCQPVRTENRKAGESAYLLKWFCINTDDPKHGELCSSRDDGRDRPTRPLRKADKPVVTSGGLK